MENPRYQRRGLNVTKVELRRGKVASYRRLRDAWIFRGAWEWIQDRFFFFF